MDRERERMSEEETEYKKERMTGRNEATMREGKKHGFRENEVERIRIAKREDERVERRKE